MSVETGRGEQMVKSDKVIGEQVDSRKECDWVGSSQQANEQQDYSLQNRWHAGKG